MRIKKLALHNQILLALFLGSLFGVFFSVDSHKLIFKSYDETKTEIKNWEKIEIDLLNQKTIFKENEQIKIIEYYKKLKKTERQKLSINVYYDNKTQNFNNIQKIRKEKTPAIIIKPLGSLFINLLSFLAIPLVLASLITGVSSLDSVKKLGKIGGKTFTVYIITTAIAITIGLTIANIIQPGNRIPAEEKSRMMGSFESEETSIEEEFEIDIVNFFLDIVPKNPFTAISKGNMIQVVFIAVFFGIALTLIPKDKSKPILDFFNGVNESMIKMVEIVMYIAPYGVFALISATIADFGYNILGTLLWYILSVILGLLLQTILVYAFIVKFLGKEKISKFFKSIRNAQAIAFSTSSSAATLPITYDCVENNLGVKKQISGFVLPLGATMNMDGTALYQGVAAVFIAQIYGIDLNITEQLTIVMTAVLASIGTAPVPGVGIIMLVIILQSVNIPPQGIALILGVDRILDMLRTVTNVTGDSAVAVAVNKMKN